MIGSGMRRPSIIAAIYYGLMLTAASAQVVAPALGTVSDAEAPTGNGTVIALSKAQRTILTNLLAGYGAQSDAATPATGANGSMIALTKAIRDKLNGTVAVTGTFFQATQPVSAAVLPLPTGASTSAAQALQLTATQTGTSLAFSSNIIGRLGSGIAYTETATPLAANGTLTGGSRNTGYGQSASTAYSYFTAQAFADAAGTLYVENSADGTTWYPANGTAGTALAANTTVTFKAPATINLWRVRFANGATAQTKFFLTAMFSAS